MRGHPEGPESLQPGAQRPRRRSSLRYSYNAGSAGPPPLGRHGATHTYLVHPSSPGPSSWVLLLFTWYEHLDAQRGPMLTLRPPGAFGCFISPCVDLMMTERLLLVLAETKNRSQAPFTFRKVRTIKSCWRTYTNDMKKYERVCCLLVLDSVTSTQQWIRQASRS